MRYLPSIVVVMAVQAAATIATMVAGTGNGSFVGLGAMLLGIMGIPLVLLACILLAVHHRKNPGKSYYPRLLLIALLLPLLQIALFVAVAVFRL